MFACMFKSNRYPESDATLHGIVDTFSAYLECEDASLKVTDVSEYTRIGSEYTGQFTLNVTSPTCTIADVSFNTGPSILFDAIAPRNESHNITFGFARFGDCIEAEEHRILVSTGIIHVVEHWNGSEYGNIGLTLPWDKMLHMVNSTNFLCAPHYRIGKSEVVKKTNATYGDIYESIEQVDHPDNQASYATNVARGVFQSINNPIAAAQGFYSLDSSVLTLSDTFFTLMTQQHTQSGKVAPASDFWFQSENLEQYTSLLYGSIAAQIAAQNLLTPSSTHIVGSVIVNKPRLFVRVLSFTLMEIGLVVLASIAASLVYCTGRPIVRHDPGSVSGIASILAQSPELCKLVKANATSTVSDIEAELEKHMYSTCLESDKRVVIEVSRASMAAGALASTKEAPDQTPVRWWQPLTLSSVSRLLTVLAPLAYIVVLEVLFATSKSRDGLIDVDHSSWTHYGWTYLPALAMVCLQTLYASVAFYIRLLSPFATMKASPAHASISVHDHPLSRIALHEAFITARRRQFGVLAATIAALLAPLLTIAVAGLYTAENYHRNVSMRQLTAWNFVSGGTRNTTLVQDAFAQFNEPNPTNYSNGYNTAPFTDLIVTSNLSYPQWTFDELAFPMVQLEDQTSTSADSSTPSEGTLNLPVPAIRGILDCSVIPEKHISITYATYESYPSAIYNETAEWAMAGNRKCLNFTPSTGFYPDNGYPLPIPGCRTALFRTSSTYTPDDCIVAPQAVFLPSSSERPQTFGYFALQGYQAQHNALHCPWYVGMIGSVTSGNVENYTWFSCTTDVESVNTQTVLTVPDYSISKVVINETSGKRVESKTEIEVPVNSSFSNSVNVTGTNAALYQTNLATDVNQYLTYYNISSGQNYDNFFSALIYGRDGVPPSEMIGPSNVPRLFSAVQHLWRVYLAQQFRISEFVLSADPSDIKRSAPQQPLNATLVDPNAYRLKQSEVSTRILQGLLAALSLCAIITLLLTDTHAVLPNNPCSIAAVAGLLAGSEMLDVMASKENESDEQHKWEGYFFSLGLWPLPGNGKRFGIDIGKAEKASQPRSGGSSWAALRERTSHYSSRVRHRLEEQRE